MKSDGKEPEVRSPGAPAGADMEESEQVGCAQSSSTPSGHADACPLAANGVAGVAATSAFAPPPRSCVEEGVGKKDASRRPRRTTFAVEEAVDVAPEVVAPVADAALAKEAASPPPEAPRPDEARAEESQAAEPRPRREVIKASRTILGLDDSPPSAADIFEASFAPGGSGGGAAGRRGDSAPPALERGRVQAGQRRATRLSMRPRRSMFATKKSRATAPCGLPGAVAAAAQHIVAAKEGEAASGVAADAGDREAAAEEGAEAKEHEADESEEETTETEDEEDEFDGGMRKEEWPEFLARMLAVVQAEGIENEPAALFEAFRTTDDVRLIFATFARLFHLATAPVSEGGRRKTITCRVAPPWADDGGNTWTFPYEPIRVLLGGNFKAKRIWTLLDARASRPEYVEAAAGGGRLQGRRCLVVGAGPCGLRTAIELRLLGAKVTVVDQRRKFNRINQLHIWDWVGEDLKGLGAKCIDPPGSTFGSNPDLMHITINELQKFLLKIALLLGVEVLLGASYVDVKHTHGEWCAELSLALSRPVAEGRASNWVCLTPSSQGPPPSPSAPRHLNDIAVLVGAGGFSSTVGEQLGMQMTEMGSLRRESAIGLICNLSRTNAKSEGKLRSYALARQFYGALFKSTAQATGADLENVVYVKSSLSHYFVMTPTAKSLKECGVVKDPTHQPLLASKNVDPVKLDELVRKVTNFPFKKDEPPVLQASLGDASGDFPGYADEGPRLFDFSKMRRSQEGLKVVPPPGVDPDASGVEDDSLLAALVGDCLMEPFWPEGLGIIRGFFSALDACSAVKRWAEGADRKKTAAHFEASFAKLKTLGAASRARVLQENEKKYGLAPESRYRL